MVGAWSTDETWGERTRGLKAPTPWHKPRVLPEGLVEAARSGWREGRKRIRSAVAIARSARLGTPRARASAEAALRAAPGRLRAAARRAVDAAGFGPLRRLLLRHPSLALALAVPAAASSVLLFFWMGGVAAVLGLWGVAIGSIFANQAAREMLGDDADLTNPSAREILP